MRSTPVDFNFPDCSKLTIGMLLFFFLCQYFFWKGETDRVLLSAGLGEAKLQ
jgi:hypothetical protein